MKYFRHFLSEIASYNKWRRKGLSWDSSFAESRSKTNSSSSSLVREATMSRRQAKSMNEYGAFYDSSVHDDQDIKPKKLTKTQQNAIHHFCNIDSDHEFYGHGSSRNVNAFLRNSSGDKAQSVEYHKPSKVIGAIKKISSAFTPENTNKKLIVTHGGIPRKIGESLMNAGPGSEHHLAGFTSTSTDRNIANDYSRGYGAETGDDNSKQPHHVIMYHIKPGAGLSVAHHSEFEENEVLLHHGAKITYMKSEEPKTDNDGHTYIVHHVIVHPEHKSLDQYGEYHHG